ncbi:hypothetical protein QBC40DRAFT_298067 [Triangularia verruculosa]|uniref:Uncharacterized protein n=1 Tax=Triangularia verruculosa TaxID=2587418 RepID=A0AAN7AVF9_9PEZI|nr:hypothetical protein QBC40DRAFT_298067 [Triangularia verruculosa]
MASTHPNDNVSIPSREQRAVVNWMITNMRGGFNEKRLPSQGCPSQFVTISQGDIRRDPELKDWGKKGTINVRIGATTVKYVNFQSQIGTKPNRPTYSHVNVVADQEVGVDLIREAMVKSLEESKTYWVVETRPGEYKHQPEAPGKAV